jgi:hypothetical protein
MRGPFDSCLLWILLSAFSHQVNCPRRVPPTASLRDPVVGLASTPRPLSRRGRPFFDILHLITDVRTRVRTIVIFRLLAALKRVV